MNQLSMRDLQQHVPILGWLLIAEHALFLVVAAVVLLLFTGVGVGSNDAEARAILGFFGIGIGALLAVLAIPGLLAGYGLLTRRSWGGSWPSSWPCWG